MASRNSFVAKQSFLFAAAAATSETDPSEECEWEFDEADVWNSSSSSSSTDQTNPKKNNKKTLPSSSTTSLPKSASRKKKVENNGGGGGACRVTPSSSLPVNIPDWSKILKQDHKEHPKWDTYGDDAVDYDYHYDDGGENHHRGIRVPPHEYLARTRGASLSVHEGIGRTLKGRDLRSVRNAIWKKVGFED